MPRSRKPDDELPPELLRIIEALAESQARKDFARSLASEVERVRKPSLRYRKFLERKSKKISEEG